MFVGGLVLFALKADVVVVRPAEKYQLLPEVDIAALLLWIDD